MELPVIIQQLAQKLLLEVREHPQHQLKPIQRYRLYKQLEPDLPYGVPHPILGRLAILTAQKILPIWQQVLPLYSKQEIVQTELDEIVIDNELPQYLITLAERVLAGKIDVPSAKKLSGDYWTIVSNIVDYKLSERKDVMLNRVAHVCLAALMALCETLFGSMFEGVRGWEAYDDTSLGYARDTASEAIKAYTSGDQIRTSDNDKRLEFWEWWLTQALPLAWQLSQKPSQIQYSREAYLEELANAPLDDEAFTALTSYLNQQELDEN